MKNRNLIIILLIPFSINQTLYCQEINGLAVYKKKSLNSEALNKIKDLKIREILSETNEKAEELDYILKFNKVESTFNVIEPMDFDGSMTTKLAIQAADGQGLRYTNLKSREYLYQNEVFRENFLISNSLDSIQWKLTNQSKMINGYKCYKAETIKMVISSKEITSSTIEAWYAPELSLNFGPLGYAGLPGLIIQLNIGNYWTYYMTELDLSSSEPVIIKKPTKGKKITSFEFQELTKKLAGQSREYLRN